MTDTIRADEFIELTLARLCEQLGDTLDAETLFVKSPIFIGLDDAIRDTIEKLGRKKRRSTGKVQKRRNKLAVLLETPGGYIEVVERISNVFRKHFKEVFFIIPNHAYSAGTVLALSGDRIYMDYYSVLGPIDPQLEDENGQFIPGMGILFKYNDLVEKSRAGTITDAELMFLTRRFNPAEMFIIEQAKNHSEELIRKWLVRYKFKNWKRTKRTNRPVTRKMKRERAASIAETLGDAGRWHSHGRGISLKDLEGRYIKLVIDNFGTDKKLAPVIKQYYDLFKDYTQKVRFTNTLHSRLGLRRLQ